MLMSKSVQSSQARSRMMRPSCLQPLIKRCAREGGQKSDLHFIQAGIAHEIENIVEDFRRVAIQSENETAIHGDAVGLDFRDGRFVEILLARFPVAVQLDAVEAGLRAGFPGQ